MSISEETLDSRFRALVSDTADRIATEMRSACPSSAFLASLSTEVEAARADPSSAPFPELADPDNYWAASVKPQGLALRRTVSGILEWLESGIVVIIGAAEMELKESVDVAASRSEVDAEGARRSIQSQVSERCHELHRLMGEASQIVPPTQLFDEERESFGRRLNAQAEADVDELKDAYMSGAGGDEQHQQFAQQKWAETHAERVSYREALLLAEPPWRHQDLALVGYEQSHQLVAEMVESAVKGLQDPLVAMIEPLMERYDAST